MFKNHQLKIATRNLWRKPSYTFINVSGLAIGIAASLLIFLVIHSDLTYDVWQSKYDRIYRVVTTYSNAGNGEVKGHESAVPLPLPLAMRTDFPQIDRLAAVWNIGQAQIHVPGPRGLEDEKIFKGDRGMFFAEAAFFSIFDYEWLEGNAAGLKDPNTVVITKSMADTWFGSPAKAIGKTVEMWSFRIPFRIIGVFKDLPYNTEMQVRFGASYPTFVKINGGGAGFYDAGRWKDTPWPSECFLFVDKKTDIHSVQTGLSRFVAKYYPTEQVRGATRTSLSLQPLKEMHLSEEFYTYRGDALTHKELWTLALIGSFLLLVACINFINLATAQSVNRAKEIGVRKVLGSNRLGLMRQFLQETALISFIAIALGCLLAILALPFLDQLMQKPLRLDFFHNPAILIFLLSTGMIVTFLSGFYPGLVLSRFNPVAALKSKISVRTVGGISLRRGLVVVQFVIAQLLIIGTLVVILQMKFFRSQPMGFEKKAIALIELPSDSTDRLKYEYLKAQILKVPGVLAASYCMEGPAAWGLPGNDIYFDYSPVKKDFNVKMQFADTGYLNTFRIGMAAGRIPYASDTARELLVNETLVKMLGLHAPSEILGKTIAFGQGGQGYPVVGVMRDFNIRSLREAIAPLVFTTNAGAYTYISFRMEGDRVNAAMENVQKVFRNTYPYYLYDMHFMDQTIDAFYRSELITSQLFKAFAFLAILISCLGLYGLVSFMAVQKTKEVGIRKVLGASVQGIVYMFSREFTILIGVAFLISAPLGYYLMHHWLSGFFYHIEMGWGVFALALASSLVVSWVTVGYRAIRAATANPVKSLRTD